MRSFTRKSGFTLVEMLIVLTVIVILTALTVKIAKRVEDQGKERLTKATLGIIDAALEQFKDFKYQYKGLYDGLKFPIDCNGFSDSEICDNISLKEAINVINLDVIKHTTYDPNVSGISVMYFLLSQVPECRETLNKIDGSLKTAKALNNQQLTIKADFGIGFQEYPFIRINDAWGTVLRYDYYAGKKGGSIRYWTVPAQPDMLRTFPLVTSAGPDKKFDTADDITNEK
jgi:prepilin-type N-terminal cleavage/methylation domain-containing protein